MINFREFHDLDVTQKTQPNFEPLKMGNFAASKLNYLHYSVVYKSEYFQYTHHRKEFYEFMVSSTCTVFHFVNISIIGIAINFKLDLLISRLAPQRKLNI